MDIITDPKLRSFVDVPEGSHFPIQNLPFGVYRRKGETRPGRVCVAIGEYILDVGLVESFGHFNGPELKGRKVFGGSTLNPFLQLGRKAWREARERLTRILSAGDQTLRSDPILLDRALIPVEEVEMLLPFEVGDYTDFYSSREHATNLGAMFRSRENALLPNWLHLPVAYHGRSSTIVPSGTDIRRPRGQMLLEGNPSPVFGPSKALDYEFEVGFVTGDGPGMGRSVAAVDAEDHIFGFVLVNDWSARDIQKWEYQPLGPFLAKNFATTISCWVVMWDALAPFLVQGPVQDPQPLPYLQTAGANNFDINLEANLKISEDSEPVTICRTNTRHLYWNVRQQLAHHTINGCHVRAGDLMASGTISGPEPESRGSLIERTWKGEQPIELPTGGRRVFLQDGDRLTLSGWAEKDGVRVGFGECTGKIIPAEK